MTTAEAREQLHRHIDELSPRLLEIVIRSCHVLFAQVWSGSSRWYPASRGDTTEINTKG